MYEMNPFSCVFQMNFMLTEHDKFTTIERLCVFAAIYNRSFVALFFRHCHTESDHFLWKHFTLGQHMEFGDVQFVAQ